jgi:hypothetical protein
VKPLRFTRQIQTIALMMGMTMSSLAIAQAPAAPPASAIPPAWAQGRTPDQVALNLVPHPPGMTALPVSDIPTDKLKVPAGFKVELDRKSVV